MNSVQSSHTGGGSMGKKDSQIEVTQTHTNIYNLIQNNCVQLSCGHIVVVGNSVFLFFCCQVQGYFFFFLLLVMLSWVLWQQYKDDNNRNNSERLHGHVTFIATQLIWIRCCVCCRTDHTVLFSHLNFPEVTTTYMAKG